MLRNGSINAIVSPSETETGNGSGLPNSSDLPALPDGATITASSPGRITWERIQPVQDWLVVRADEKPETAEVSAPRMARPTGQRDMQGRPIFIVEQNAEERAPLWSGRVLARGPGLTTITRCLDGDRMGFAPKLCTSGQRVFYWGEPPWLQRWNWETTIEGEREMLIREYPCVASVIEEAA